MRPEILYPLFGAVTTLKGVGPKIAESLEKLGIRTIADLLWHLPSGIVDRRFAPSVKSAPDGRIATFTLTIDRHVPAKSRRQPTRVLAHDDSGQITLTFFRGDSKWLESQLPVGEQRIVSGRVDYYQGEPQISHPDHIAPVNEADKIMRVEPVYPLTAGLAPKSLARAIDQAVERVSPLPDWLDPALVRQRGWPDWDQAVRAVHAPGSSTDLDAKSPARARLAYDELLANQVALALVRRSMRVTRGEALHPTGALSAKIRDALPYALTRAQEQALADCVADLESPNRMMRLVQGDVGSGKTIVALLAMAATIEAGGQAALMAPTEILARQHFQGIDRLANAAGITIELLTGRDKGQTRADKLARIASGDAQIVIGTHALFQDDVAFANLRLAVIDEQHRFGVHQRLQLSAKANAPVDVLVMTATPIPRTLTLTAYGDLDVSRITEKPPGRQPIDTVAVPADRMAELVGRIAGVLERGERAYWVCPLVEENTELNLAAAMDRFEALKKQFGPKVGLVHGRMKGPEKDQVMRAFQAGDLQILVATTVIEVGVDVPEATIMVIEHAERFGLAQLHQLRGRVGRGDRRSVCVLLYDTPLSDTAKKRLAIMRETEDGFRIAEEDLKLRGAGDLLGTQQSGLPRFKLADLALHDDLLAMARDDAVLVLNKDPGLEGERGQALRVLLYLFERDEAVRYFRSA